MKEEQIQEGINKAIEILGKPIMSYAPEITLRENETKINEAVKILLDIRWYITGER